MIEELKPNKDPDSDEVTLTPGDLPSRQGLNTLSLITSDDVDEAVEDWRSLSELGEYKDILNSEVANE